MRRILPLVVVAAFALAAALWFAGGGDPGHTALAVSVEKRLQARDVAGARREIDAARGKAPAWRVDYLDALLLFTEGKIAESLVASQRAFAANPDDWRVVSLVFYALLRSDRGVAAWQALDGYLRTHPDDERALACAVQYWAEIRIDTPDLDRAEEYLDRIEALERHAAPAGDPTAITPALVARLRSSVEAARGRMQSAVRAARDAAERSPGDVTAHVNLAELLRKSGDLAGAADAMRRAVQLRPSEPVYWEQLAMLLLALPDRGAEAQAAAARLAELVPGSSAAAVLEARALVRLDRIDDAITIYRRLLAGDLPVARRREVLRNLGVALYDWKQGGTDGDYLDEAHGLLAEYVRLGGEIDERLMDTWMTLEARAAGNGAERPR